MLFKPLADMEFVPSSPAEMHSTGTDYWLNRVLRECDRARRDFDPEPVHDLRVSLRRCRSIADVYMAFDSHPAWRQIKKDGKKLFRELGDLRDIQVMIERLQSVAPGPDEAMIILSGYLANQQDRLKTAAAKALQDFNQKRWGSRIRRLAKRARRIPPEGMAFQHLALERWSDAYELHRQALRNRSHVAFHRLRIGLKKFRYVVENFLPTRHEQWGGGLKKLQDILGEMHDLQILWQTALSIKAFHDKEILMKWRQRISAENVRLLEEYKYLMLGKESLWRVWRLDLPKSEQIRIAALARLRAWASYRDPDFAHSEHVAKLALEIYDGLDSMGLFQDLGMPDSRFLLEAAALAHDVGKDKAEKKHHLATYRMIGKLEPSPGWTVDALKCLALIARFHRGALPWADHKSFSPLSPDKRKGVLLLCGILRLANAFDCPHQRRIRKLILKRTGEAIYVHAPGYDEKDAAAERLAAARHLLETACGMPILIRQP